MKVKHVQFPTFEEWKAKEYSWESKIGEYNIRIAIFSWGNKSTTYAFGVAACQNPLNIWSSRIYYEPFTCENGEGLEDWYNNQVSRFKEFWENYINKNYLD